MPSINDARKGHHFDLFGKTIGLIPRIDDSEPLQGKVLKGQRLEDTNNECSLQDVAVFPDSRVGDDEGARELGLFLSDKPGKENVFDVLPGIQHRQNKNYIISHSIHNPPRPNNEFTV